MIVRGQLEYGRGKVISDLEIDLRVSQDMPGGAPGLRSWSGSMHLPTVTAFPLDGTTVRIVFDDGRAGDAILDVAFDEEPVASVTFVGAGPLEQGIR